jgi:hypothetical protein
MQAHAAAMFNYLCRHTSVNPNSADCLIQGGAPPLRTGSQVPSSHGVDGDLVGHGIRITQEKSRLMPFISGFGFGKHS